jgi:Trypsin
MDARRRGPRTGVLVGISFAAAYVLTGAAPHGHTGSGTVVHPPTCRSRSDCGPRVMGGLQITFTGWSCTTGFVASDTQARHLFVLTAGHCLAGSGVSALWSHHGAAIGRATAEVFHRGSGADVGEIEIAGPGSSDEIYGPTNADIRTLTGWAPNASQTIGSEVCRSGVTSGWRCGSIVAADVDTTLMGTLIRHTWWTDFPSASGDSGAPVVDRDGRAAGILIATTPTQSVYSTVDWIATELHVRPCVESTC